MNDSSNDQRFVKQAIEASIRIGLILLLVYWCLDIVSPFIGPVLWGVIIAIGSQPIFQWIKNTTKLNNGLSAALFSVLMIGCLITPTIYLSEALLGNAQDLSDGLKDGVINIPPPSEKISSLPIVGEDLSKLWLQASEDPKSILGSYESEVKAVAQGVVKGISNVGLVVLTAFFAIVIAGFFLANSEGGKKATVDVMTRLVGEKGEALAELSHRTISSVVRGILGIATLQAILAGMGFLVMDIPGAGILAIVCLVLAIVQIDILIVLIPISIYVFSTSGTVVAVLFLIWNLAVGLINNVLKPILLGRGVEAPMVVIFVGAIGGMIAYGIIGLFVGAVMLVLSYTLFFEWLHSGENQDAIGSDSEEKLG